MPDVLPIGCRPRRHRSVLAMNRERILILKAIAAYAGQSAVPTDTLPTAAARIATLVSQAEAALYRLAAMKEPVAEAEI